MSSPTLLEAYFPLFAARQGFVDKVWGQESILANDEYCLKLLAVNPGFRCSLHLHPRKAETFIVLYGRVRLELEQPSRIDDPEPIPISLVRNMPPGHRQRILPGTKHRFGSEGGALILEVSTHHEDSDVVRFEPSGPIPKSEVTDAGAPGDPVRQAP